MADQDQVIVVHGALGELSRSLARPISEDGAAIAAGGRDAEEGARFVEAIESRGGRASFLHMEGDDDASAQALASEAVMSFGAIDGLVNVLPDVSPRGALDGTVEAWNASVSRPLQAAWAVCRHAAPFLAKSENGSIVNLLPLDPRQPGYGQAFGATLSGALWGLTRALATDLGPAGIRVNSVTLGVIETETWRQAWKKRPEGGKSFDELLRAHPLRRLGRAKDVARAVLFLLGPNSGFLTGSIVPLDGGARLLSGGHGDA